ncbi:MAG: hypothetical protein GY934_02975 [Gammaproteobacteria bacterium]|nr:hypothetical protein [Gammaproteobacteria bacterium]
MPLKVIALYSAGHLGSATILNRLLTMPEYKIVGVIKTQAVEFSPQGIKKLRKYFKKTGWRFAWLLFWQRLLQGLGFTITLLLPFLRRRLKPAWKIAAERDIPVLYCKNINDARSEAFIRKLAPDLLISAYFSQILKPPIIQLPKMGTLNVHPGWLPAYKGAMAYFWVLRHGEHRAGVTVHWIDNGIDTGVLISRKSFLLKQGMTQQNVLVISAVIGARLLQRIGKKLIANRSLDTINIKPSEADGYYPLPGEQAFDAYFKHNRFFRIRDVLGLLIGKKTP